MNKERDVHLLILTERALVLSRIEKRSLASGSVVGRFFVGGQVAFGRGSGVGPLREPFDLFAELFDVGPHGVDYAVLLFDVPFEKRLFNLKILDW